MPQPNEVVKKSFNQPAKQAERVIAPGEAAEPGETQTKIFGEPTKWAMDETFKLAQLDR